MSNDKDIASVLFPEMQSTEEEENPQVSSPAARELFPEMSAEQQSADLTEEDHQSLNNMNALLDRGEYQELGDKVEAELRGLGLSEEELEPELELLNYARKYITDSPDWQWWTRAAIRNLHRARVYYRKKA